MGGQAVACKVSNAAANPAPESNPVQPVNPTPSQPTSPPPADPQPPPDTADPEPTPLDAITPPQGPAVLGQRKVIGYYPAWEPIRNYQVADIPGEKVSHLNYAFANISGGKCVLGDSYADIDKAFAGDTWDTGVLRGNFNQLIKLREQTPNCRR